MNSPSFETAIIIVLLAYLLLAILVSVAMRGRRG